MSEVNTSCGLEAGVFLVYTYLKGNVKVRGKLSKTSKNRFSSLQKHSAFTCHSNRKNKERQNEKKIESKIAKHSLTLKVLPKANFIWVSFVGDGPTFYKIFQTADSKLVKKTKQKKKQPKPKQKLWRLYLLQRLPNRIAKVRIWQTCAILFPVLLISCAVVCHSILLYF